MLGKVLNRGRLETEHAVLARCAQQPGEALQCRAEVAGHHPHFVGVAACHLRQRLQVLVGQHLRGGPAGLDRGERLLDGLGLPLRPQVGGGAFTLGAQNPGLPLCLSSQNHGLSGTLGGQDLGLLGALGLGDRGLPAAFGGQDHRPLLPVGLHLLFHRGLNRPRRVDAAQLPPCPPQAPAVGRLVEHAAQLAVGAHLRVRDRIVNAIPAASFLATYAALTWKGPHPG